MARRFKKGDTVAHRQHPWRNYVTVVDCGPDGLGGYWMFVVDKEGRTSPRIDTELYEKVQVFRST